MAANNFQLRRTSVSGRIPTVAQLGTGGLGLNMPDRILYSTDGSTVFPIGANLVNMNITNNLTVGGVISGNGASLTSVNAASSFTQLSGTLLASQDPIEMHRICGGI